MERNGLTSLNVPEWVLCGVGWILTFFSYWPMDYLFITRIWILLWSCMWACDFVDFTWSLFVFPKVKGRAFRPGPVPQLHQAVNRLMELGFRAFAIVLSSSLFIPMIFRSLLAGKNTSESPQNQAYLPRRALPRQGHLHERSVHLRLRSCRCICPADE